MDIKITPKVLAPAVPTLHAIRVAPRMPAPTRDTGLFGPTMSKLPWDPNGTEPLTEAEINAELRVAAAIVAEMVYVAGYDLADVKVDVTFKRGFTRRLGDARAHSYSLKNPTGRIRLAASALWRRATPQDRRETVVHELAHVFADCEDANAGHGTTWKRWMVKFGYPNPERCHAINRDGLRRRRRTRNGPRPITVNPNAKVRDFVVGQRVKFIARGQTITGAIIRRGKLRLTIATDDGREWRCTPAILWKL